MKVNHYPTLKEVKKASKKQLAYWYRFLPSPGVNPNTVKVDEDDILDLIIELLFKHIN
jgi:hypothetical protein